MSTTSLTQSLEYAAEQGGATMSLVRADRLNRWHFLFATLLALAGVAVTYEAWADIYHIATTDDEYSHIFIVPIVAIYLVWVRRMRIRHCKPAGMMTGPLMIAIGWAILSYGFYHGVQSFWHGGSVIVVLGCAISILGKNVLLRFLPAFAVLVFLVPVPGTIRQAIALPLQTWTAQIAHVIMQLLGIDSEVSGNLLNVNGKLVTIAEACNGVRGIFALGLVSYAFAFGMPLRNWVRLVILISSPLATLICNVLRIIPTAWLYGYKSESVARIFHDAAGWAILPLAFLLLYGIISLLRWAMIPVIRYPLASQSA
jgi:exosortase